MPGIPPIPEDDARIVRVWRPADKAICFWVESEGRKYALFSKGDDHKPSSWYPNQPRLGPMLDEAQERFLMETHQ